MEERRPDERRRDDRGYDRRPDRREDRVMGMGDHVPDFILRSFAIAAPVADEAEDEAPATGTEG